MGLFNLNKNKKAKSDSKINEDSKANINLLRSVSTEEMDLSQPFVDDNFSGGNNYVNFGEGNLYPQILNQLYLSSTMHSACVDFKTWSVIGDGYEWSNYNTLGAGDIIQLKTFERRNDFKKSIKKLTKDWVKHGRAIVLLHFNKSIKEYDFFKVVDPSELRNSKETIFTKDLLYYFSADWIYRKKLSKFTSYSEKNNNEWQILEIKNDVGSSRSYGLPDWLSSANWMKVSADLGLLHKSALENGINPGLIFKYPFEMNDEENQIWVENMAQNHKGSRNTDRAMKIEANGEENLPVIEQIQSSDTTTLFEQTSKEQKEEIAISHNINPALMGVRIQGSLGANEEIQFSSKQFEKIWLNDNRSIIEDFANDIISIFNITNSIVINKTDIMSSLKEEEQKQVQMKDSDGNPVEEPTVNENLKGLSAKENADIYRIIRDFERGKLNEQIAKARILAYGISSEMVDKILDKEKIKKK